jgi:serine/threonine protein kinase
MMQLTSGPKMQELRTLGAGGFSTVHLVRTEDGQLLARKTFVPPAAFGDDSVRIGIARNRFRTEVDCQRKINHPNVVRIISSDINAIRPWYTMPVATYSFSAKISSDRRYGVAATQALWDILAGLEAIHSVGWQHRDLKPANVLLIDDQWAVSDFGLVRVDVAEEARQTGIGEALGTLDYIAPECYKDSRDASVESDIYSVGCILHDVFSDGDRRVPCSTHTVSGPMKEVVERCTSQSPSLRFRSVASLRGAMVRAILPVKETLASPEAFRWDSRLRERVEDVTRADCARLLEFLQNRATTADRELLYLALDVEQMDYIRRANWRVCDTLSMGMCHWVRELIVAGRTPVYMADLLGARLSHICKVGNLVVQVAAATALLELASRNNRQHLVWCWMRQVGNDAGTDFIQRLSVALSSSNGNGQSLMTRVHHLWDDRLGDLHPELAAVVAARLRLNAG